MLYEKGQNRIVIVVIAILIVVVSGTSAGIAIPIVQATSENGNNEQASDNGNDVLTFEGELLPQQSPSNENVIQFEETHPETIVQSDNLQNPSIQESVQQQQQQQQQTPDLSSGKQQQQPKENHDYIFELPNGEGCYWYTNPVTDATWVRCTTAEAYDAWDKHEKTAKSMNEDDKTGHLIQDFSRPP